MKKIISLIFLCPLFAACSESEILAPEEECSDKVEMKDVRPAMTRSGEVIEVAELVDYVGRSEFSNNDVAVFTKICRTMNPITQFTYQGIQFKATVKEEEDETISIGWQRIADVGSTQTAPDRIYWTDATRNHTFIGYCVPQQGTDPDFDWTLTDGNYYGSIGHDTDTEIDFRSEYDPETKAETLSGNTKLCKNDILLTYSDTITAQNAIAKIQFHHGLAQVRVIVNISEFAAGGGKDTLSVVSDMVLKDMLTKYQWNQRSYETTAVVSDNTQKDFKLWIPRPAGRGEGSSKTFTFYSLAVPTTIPADQPLNLSFKVTYPDPMHPTETQTKNYAASISDIVFSAGKCTTISVSLNHRNEKMTIGAEYDDWEFVDTPDEGELKKNVTFLRSTTRSIKDPDTGYYNVTILGDPNANADDATWLYVDANDDNKIKDIYGNDGSAASPFQISTADQLLSFAYEVKGTSRSVAYKDLNATARTLTNNFDFTGYYVKLDADITLQESLDIMHDADGFYTLNSEGNRVAAASGVGVTWLGIGDAAHQFNGVFNGGYRHINRLYGAPFFNTIGPDGIVDHLFFSDALGITGRGSIAEVNYGVICGAYIEGDVEATNIGALAGSYCGSIVGENHSMLISCTHIGNITGVGYETVGTLLGYNDGIVAICYNSGNVDGNGEHEYAGIGKYSPRSIAYCSYFNSDLYKGSDYDNLNERIGHVAFPLTTAKMWSNAFVNKKAIMDGDLSSADEIYDDGLSNKTDPFFFHLSLNYGIRRAVAMLRRVLGQQADAEGKIQIHPASSGTSAPNRFEELRLKKTLVQWLVNHYSTEKDGDELEFSHQFIFIPGTYPKLQ